MISEDEQTEQLWNKYVSDMNKVSEVKKLKKVNTKIENGIKTVITTLVSKQEINTDNEYETIINVQTEESHKWRYAFFILLASIFFIISLYFVFNSFIS